MKLNEKLILINYFVYVCKNRPYRVVFSFIAIFIMALVFYYTITNSIVGFEEQLLSIAIIYIAGFAFMYVSLPVLHEIGLYGYFYPALNDLKKLEESIKKDNKKRIQFRQKKFLKNTDDFRNKLKKVIINSRSFLCSHNQETLSILQNIDLFFDVTTKLIMKKENGFYPDSLNEKNMHAIKNFFEELEQFIFIELKFLNILLVNDFFENHIFILKTSHEDIFEKTKTNIEKHYLDKKIKSNWRYSIVFSIVVVLIQVAITFILDTNN